MNNSKELNINEEFYFQWHITGKCNLRCSHCYHESYSSDNELEIVDLLDVADKMEETLEKWSKKGTMSITGGEPFVVSDKMFPLLEHVDTLKHVHHFDILTNGCYITDDVVDRLKKFKKIRRIQLSLEGSTAEINDAIRGPGSFEKAINAIRLLKKNEFQVAVMMTISNFNVGEIEPLIDLLEEERVDTFAAERFIPEGRGLEMQKYLLDRDQLSQVFPGLYERALKQGKPRILLYRPLFALLDDNGRVEPGPVAEFAETGTHGEKIRGRRNLERYIWSHLNKQQVGAYAEYYVKMELTMYGFQVYGTEVDDRGIDFIARFNHGPFFEFQVKSLRSYGYVFIPKNKFEPYENRFLAFGFLVDSYPPDLYLVPSVAWKNCNDLFVSRDYPGLKSSPEWGMNLSKKNSPLLEPYRFEPMVKNILENQQTLKISL